VGIPGIELHKSFGILIRGKGGGVVIVIAKIADIGRGKTYHGGAETRRKAKIGNNPKI
jgi:hypothetical protein